MYTLANKIHEAMIAAPYRCRAFYTSVATWARYAVALTMTFSSQVSHIPPSLMDRLLLRLSPPPHANQSSQSHCRELHTTFLSLDSRFLPGPQFGPFLVGFDYAPKHLRSAFSFLNHVLTARTVPIQPDSPYHDCLCHFHYPIFLDAGLSVAG